MIDDLVIGYILGLVTLPSITGAIELYKKFFSKKGKEEKV